MSECNTIGYRNFCSACKGCEKEGEHLVCRAKDGRFYGIQVDHVLLAPCFKINHNAEVGKLAPCQFGED